MAYNFPNGFIVTNNEPIDSRLVMTKAEMLATKKARMPDTYFCVCSDDGQLYIYKSDNDVDSTTGRFRLFNSIISGDENIVTTDNLDVAVSKDENNILTVASDGLFVKESDAISDSSINNLFEEKEGE